MISDKALAIVTDNTLNREIGAIATELSNLFPEHELRQGGVYRYVDQMPLEGKITRLQKLVLIGKQAEALLQL